VLVQQLHTNYDSGYMTQAHEDSTGYYVCTCKKGFNSLKDLRAHHQRYKNLESPQVENPPAIQQMTWAEGGDVIDTARQGAGGDIKHPEIGKQGEREESGAQPPFANSFPSFGTTLTAEQQNALERRKQEEQYLMARQKEHLAAQQQVLAKAQMGIPPHGILPHQLHHHSSAHSLHSQPSFGSITSPGGYQPSPTQGPVPGGPWAWSDRTGDGHVG
jgi:hypothetical protein